MDTAALKASWGKVAAAGDDVPLYFYSHLFLSHPDVRSMFPIQMSGQRDKLVTALGAVVSNVDEIDKVLPLLEQLGRDHRRFSRTTSSPLGTAATWPTPGPRRTASSPKSWLLLPSSTRT